jgi:hypothetical protein
MEGELIAQLKDMWLQVIGQVLLEAYRQSHFDMSLIVRI